MAMKKCPACQWPVSSTANTCPRCGDNLSARRILKLTLAICAIMPLGIVLIALRNTPEPTPINDVQRPRQIETTSAQAPAKSQSPAPATPEIRPDELLYISPDYRIDVAKMLNVLRRENEFCRQELYPYNAGMSSQQPDPANPSFFVMCGDKKITVLHFSWMDVVNKQAPVSPVAITRNEAFRVCRDYARSQVDRPDALEVSGIMDLAFTANDNGTAILFTTATAKNGLGAEMKYNVRCSFSRQTLTESRMWPAQ
ncbi:zinc ribbon domain-containing protein [Azotobacter beijerinckii]|uniref:Putative zinc-ribbon domain-containing protein n=1 Tax=Azotobacter beijerinckii TaxID=170623 RepID=A0A1I4G256_9GAMM|nr:zinc ribbon domain-containing protein [Azotobacter beijerinckii]SFL23819.1 hypothetical protein SAMN04244574_03641 [Azotobacter beijerinckii]